MDKRRFNLSEDIINRIVYGMENQKDEFMFDPSSGDLRPSIENDGGFIPLPPWGSTEGYRLMDRFAGTLPNPVFRDRLINILHSGSGVFRQFKDALHERPEIEALWRRYKHREMRKTCLSWLGRWIDAMALEALGPEPDELDDLPLTDFNVRPANRGEFGVLAEWHRSLVLENQKIGIFIEERAFGSEGDLLFVAETPAGELIGFTWIYFLSHHPGKQQEARLFQLYVLPSYRGLGLGKRLADRAFSAAREQGASGIGVLTSAGGRYLETYLEREGFEAVAKFWRKRET